METVAEIFDRIMAAKQWNKRQLAKHMGIDSSILSQKLGAEWNHHWRVFVKLLPLLVELKIVNPNSTSDKNEGDNGGQREPKGVKSKNNVAENERLSKNIMSPIWPTSYILQ